MTLPHQSQEFVRCQAIELLSRLPAAARNSVRYYEVAALVLPFQPLPPLSGPRLKARRYFYFVVTDWSVFVIPMGGKGQVDDSVALEIPCLSIRDVVSSEEGHQQRLRRHCSALAVPVSEQLGGGTFSRHFMP